MKINKIVLRNIGPYRDENNMFDVSVNQSNNIILIGGKNGAGKTTLLNSIKIGLFGPYAFGFKTASNMYYNSLIQIFNYIEAKKKTSCYSIDIEFSIVENYIENIYHFNRSWKKVKDDISENLIIRKNDIILNEEESEIIQSKLREIIPPSVIDTMLFDGEKIAQIIDENKISEYLKEMIEVNFNINIFDKMDDDIKFYIEKERKNKTLSFDEINLIEIQNKYEEKQKNLKNIIEIKKNYEKSIYDKKFKLRYLNKKFENYGGISEESKSEMINSLEKLENIRKANMSIIKEFLEEDVIFYLNQNKVYEISEMINKEKPVLLLKYADEIGKYLGEEDVILLKEKLKKIIGKEDRIIMFNNSQNLSDSLDEVKEKFKDKPIKILKKIIENNKEDLINSKEYKKIISNNSNDNEKEFKELLKEIKTYEFEIKELEDKLRDTEREFKRIENENNIALLELENVEKKSNISKKEENSFNIARNILNLSKEYKNNQKNEILRKIANISVKKFAEIIKKENYITEININNETYNITLYDNNGIEKDITILSAGEKQLLISAIDWSIFKLSDRNNIFVFDTPLARLDKENRKLFVSNILCTISDQVFILSTNEEIVGDLYSIVNKKMSKNYLLKNDEKLGKTIIKEGYFE